MTTLSNEIGIDILIALEQRYPEPMRGDDLCAAIDGYGEEHHKELFSLHEEGLIRATISQTLFQPRQIVLAEISAKGRRVLQDRQEFVFVGLRPETLDALRELMIESLKQISIPETQRGVLKKAIESAPATAISELVKMTLAAGFQQAPELLNQLQKFLFLHR